MLFLSIHCRQQSADREGKNAEKPPVAVEVVEVVKGQLNREIEVSGVVSGINEAYVVSQTQGIIQRVKFEIGDSVSKGDLLVRVDNQIPRLNLDQAKIRLDDAKMTFTVTQTLFNKGSASKAEFTKAKSAKASAKAAYESALKTYNDCFIKAPISGRVSLKEPAVAIGNFLATGARIARIVDISRLKLEAGVGEREVSYIEEGAKARIRIPAACNQKEYDGKVTAVAAGSDPKSGSYTVLTTWDNTCEHRVKSGMSARATIKTVKEEPVLLVPTAAIFEVESRDALYVVTGGRAALRFISAGRKVNNRTEILDGIKEKEKVILTGITALSKGDRVKATLIKGSEE